jgi:flagellar hook assembly protein FlgD
LRLLGNVPNPFNPLTRIEYEVPAREGGSPVDVELSVFDAQGRLVRTLARGPHAPGRHVVTWDGRDGSGRSVATGIYLARLSAGGARVTHKLTLLR